MLYICKNLYNVRFSHLNPEFGLSYIMRSHTPEDLNGLCEHCYLRKTWCLCDKIPSIQTDVHFVIVRHYKEAYRTSNSGRLAAMALENSTMVDFGGREQHTYDPSVLEGENVWLLFPSADGTEQGGKKEVTKPDKLVILDATWRQARRMSRRIDAVRDLPRISLSPTSLDTERIRQKPQDWTMATIETLARAVEKFEGIEKATQLDQLFENMVLHFRAMRRSLPVERYLAELNDG